ncbi:Cytosolic iron-sulfur protein assembly protein [Ascosphaera acerosa]|nr:Cytosolic iron-sulfur protein assembly protein [Ascosphaera acerosa]
MRLPRPSTSQRRAVDKLQLVKQHSQLALVELPLNEQFAMAVVVAAEKLRATSADRINVLQLDGLCGSGKDVRIYSLSDCRLLATISGGHERSVRSCAWKPNCKQEVVLATGSFDATVGIWRRDEEAHADSGSSDGADVGADDDDVTEDDKWRFAVLLDGHESEVKSVAWSHSGALLATCSRDKSIWIWEDLEDGEDNFETVAVLQEHSADVKCLAWHPSEDCLASGSYDDTIRLWREDADDWGQVACLRGHTGTVWSIAWEATTRKGDDSGKACPRLASASDDGTVRIWQRVLGEQPEEPRPTPTMPSILRSMDVDETWVEQAKLPAAHNLTVYSIAWSRTTGLMASAGADGRIVIYKELDACEPAAADDDSRPQSQWQIVQTVEAAHEEYEVNQVTWTTRKLKNPGSEGNDTPDEEILLSTGDDGSVKLWRLTDGQLMDDA